MQSITFPERLVKKLSRIPFFSMTFSRVLYHLRLHSLSKIGSKYSKFVPKIVDFDILLMNGKILTGKLYGIHESNVDNITKTIWINGLKNYEKPMPQVFLYSLEQAQQLIDVGAIAVFSRMRGNKILERLTVQDSNTPHSCDYRYNSGLYSIIAALGFPDLIVHAFEPFPTALKWFEANMELDANRPIKQQIKVIKKAIGNTLGTAQLYIPIPRFGAILETSASLSSEFRDQHSESLTVDLITLDQYVAEAQLQSVDVIKIDVESQEYKVLDGSRNILKIFRPIIFLEVLEEADITSLESIRSEFNYISLWMGEEAIIQKDKVSSHPDIQNQVLCPAEKIQKFHDIAITLNLDFIN